MPAGAAAGSPRTRRPPRTARASGAPARPRARRPARRAASSPRPASRRPLALTPRADGQEMRVRTPLLFVARSAYQLESFGLAGADCVEQGRFAVYVAPDTSRVGMFAKA